MSVIRDPNGIRIFYTDSSQVNKIQTLLFPNLQPVQAKRSSFSFENQEILHVDLLLCKLIKTETKINNYLGVVSCVFSTKGYEIYDLLLGILPKKDKKATSNLQLLRQYVYLNYFDLESAEISQNKHFIVIQATSRKFVQESHFLVYKKPKYSISFDSSQRSRNPNKDLYYSIKKNQFFDSNQSKAVPMFLKLGNLAQNSDLYILSRVQGITLTKIALKNRLLTFTRPIPTKFFRDFVFTAKSITDEDSSRATTQVEYRLDVLMNTKNDSNRDLGIINSRLFGFVGMLLILLLPICVFCVTDLIKRKEKKKNLNIIEHRNRPWYEHPYSYYEDEKDYHIYSFDQYDSKNPVYKKKLNGLDNYGNFSSLLTGTVNSSYSTEKDEVIL